MHYRETRDARPCACPCRPGRWPMWTRRGPRVEGVTDIVLVEVSTYDDGSDNVPAGGRLRPR
ncbi:hypothetical protein TPA0909_02600 [Streptomyces albus]|nr:hypothetical protein TPA0909_02600 [Streptomyces albus]